MIETERLVLRWPRESDLPALRRIWSDPEAMADLDDVRTEAECDAIVARHQGYRPLGFWAVERKLDGEVIGFTGLKPGGEGTPAQGEVEIGWTLRRDYWGLGYAREAAEASLDWGWDNRVAARIFAVIARVNQRSRALAARIGMAELPELAFDHGRHPQGDRRRPTLVYAVDRPAAR